MSDLAADSPAPPPDGRADRRADRPLGDGRVRVWRHPAWVRVTHWVNVVAVVVLLMSGLNILAAHPHLYWGIRSTFADPWLSTPTLPGWMLIPPVRDLAQARNYHFLFAWLFVFNGLIYLLLGVVTRRFGRRLWPTATELKGFGASVVEHARFRFATDEHARAYNVLQKLAYLVVIWLILPLMLVTGLSMSPGFNAAAPWMLELLGGRQSARTLHFISAGLIVGFIVVHVGLVIWTGLVNNMRAMLTGWFVLERPGSVAGRRARTGEDQGDAS